MSKPTLCLDFDGVIHSYTSGWKGADVILDPPVDGALGFIVHAMHKFDVCIFSSRSGQPGGIEAMKGWLLHHGLPERYLTDRPEGIIRFPLEKPAAFVTIDDRAIQFTGEWPTLTELLAFKPWNKRGVAA